MTIVFAMSEINKLYEVITAAVPPNGPRAV